MILNLVLYLDVLNMETWKVGSFLRSRMDKWEAPLVGAIS